MIAYEQQIIPELLKNFCKQSRTADQPAAALRNSFCERTHFNIDPIRFKSLEHLEQALKIKRFLQAELVASPQNLHLRKKPRTL